MTLTSDGTSHDRSSVVGNGDSGLATGSSGVCRWAKSRDTLLAMNTRLDRVNGRGSECSSSKAQSSEG